MIMWLNRQIFGLVAYLPNMQIGAHVLNVILRYSTLKVVFFLMKRELKMALHVTGGYMTI